MSKPVGGTTMGAHILQGEVTMLVASLQRTNRWTSLTGGLSDTEQNYLIKSLVKLRETLNKCWDIRTMDPNVFLAPFLDVIRSEDTRGPVTGLALASIDKIISYHLIDVDHPGTPAAVENIADAITHARFVGTDSSSDEVVLMRILQVLRKLLLSSLGPVMTNESVCEIMQSCFRFCFETRLSDLLRCSAEHALVDMIQHLFTHLPQFVEDNRSYISWKRLKMRPGGMENSRSRRGKNKHKDRQQKSMSSATSEESLPGIRRISAFEKWGTSKLASTPTEEETQLNPSLVTSEGDTTTDVVVYAFESLSATEDDSVTDEVESELKSGLERSVSLNYLHKETQSDAHGKSDKKHSQEPVSPKRKKDRKIASASQADEKVVPPQVTPKLASSEEPTAFSTSTHSLEASIMSSPGEVFLPDTSLSTVDTSSQDFINQQDGGALIPYGLPCLRELFRFLISLINPHDKQNSESMIQIGLNLITVVLEVSTDHLASYPSVLTLVKDELCRNLFNLLATERLTIFASTLRICFVLFESLRQQLKFQLEMYIMRLCEIIETQNSPYEQKEASLVSILHLSNIPGVVTELYLNYDCDLYTSNLFEDLTKLLSKNAFPVTGLYSVQMLSLDALLTIAESIETHCQSRIHKEGDVSPIKVSPRSNVPTITVQKTSTDSVSAVNTSANSEVYETQIPSHEELMAVKHKKKIIATATEHFNIKPAKGIQFLQDHGVFSNPLDPHEIAVFLRENHKLNKVKISDYISSRKNLEILCAYARSFDFTDMRIDEALRAYVEAFRLPGEAPLITLHLEQFSDHWHKCNGEPFADKDCAFTLAYAVIMLNTDQHNQNARKQIVPMTFEDFKKNCRGINSGKDFDSDMLSEIYHSIRSEAIVMPDEHTGKVRENYIWSLVLRRGSSKEGTYIATSEGVLDHDLFGLSWGPTVAALSYIFDKTHDEKDIIKTLDGFKKCAMISAHYGMSDVFDNLIITLCKFTTLLTSTESNSISSVAAIFGANLKAQKALETLFRLVHRHGDILREGWKNLLDCLLQLFKCGLLPEYLMEAEDFVDVGGKIRILREEIQNQRSETGLFSSLYSYIAMTDTPSSKAASLEEQENIRLAEACVQRCNTEQLITESKFLRMDSLLELIKTLIFASHGPDGHVSLGGSTYDEDSIVFLLEMLVKIVVHNKDRAPLIWPSVRDHLYSLIMGAAASEHFYIVERSVVALLRLAILLMRREDMGPTVLQSLRMLLLLKPSTLFSVSRQVGSGLHELLKSGAANVHSASDWSVFFTLLECVGAGAQTPKPIGGETDSGQAFSDNELQMGGSQHEHVVPERGYTSDTELYSESNVQRNTLRPSASINTLSTNGLQSSSSGWILVGKEGEIEHLPLKPLPINQYNIVHDRRLGPHDSYAFKSCLLSLAFLVRDVAHITPDNFGSCVQCIRTFVEAALHGGHPSQKKVVTKEPRLRKKPSISRKNAESGTRFKRSRSTPQPVASYDADESDAEETALEDEYVDLSIQLLDLMHTLHSRAAHIFKWWAEEEEKNQSESKNGVDSITLWTEGWCPLLQGIARLSCDIRKQIRMTALTYLQRALLVHDLQGLQAREWESCFNQVLFPLLTKLLEPIPPTINSAGMDETRMRAATLLSKVFLQHLNPLLSLPTFAALWLTIVDFIDKYMHADRSDLLLEAVPETLKNMLLVMYTTGIFQNSDGYTALWKITWDRVDPFLPNLRDELFKEHPAAELQKLMFEEIKDAAEMTSDVTPVSESIRPSTPSQVPVEHVESVTTSSTNNEESSTTEQNTTKVPCSTDSDLPTFTFPGSDPSGFPSSYTSSPYHTFFTNNDMKPRSANQVSPVRPWSYTAKGMTCAIGTGVSEPVSLCTPSCPLLLDPALVEGTAIPHIPIVSPTEVSPDAKGSSHDI